MPLLLLKHILAAGGVAGRTAAIARIVEEVWPAAEGDAGMRAFEVTLSRLRKILGHSQAVRAQGGRVGLDPRLCWVDLAALDALLDAPGATPEAVLALYGGRFLGDDDEAPTFGAVAARVQARVTRRLLALLERTERESPDVAASIYFRAVERDEGLVTLRAAAERCWARAQKAAAGAAGADADGSDD